MDETDTQDRSFPHLKKGDGNKFHLGKSPKKERGKNGLKGSARSQKLPFGPWQSIHHQQSQHPHTGASSIMSLFHLYPCLLLSFIQRNCSTATPLPTTKAVRTAGSARDNILELSLGSPLLSKIGHFGADCYLLYTSQLAQPAWSVGTKGES